MEFFPFQSDNKHDNISLIDYAIQYPCTSGQTNIFVHGSPISMTFFMTDITKGTMLNNIEDLEMYKDKKQIAYTISLKNGAISEDEAKKFREIVSQSTEWKEGESAIVLHSCFTGAEYLDSKQYSEVTGTQQNEGIKLDTNIAKELSKSFPQNKIIAPTSSIGPSYEFGIWGM